MSRAREYMRVVNERGKMFGRIRNDGYTGKGGRREDVCLSGSGCSSMLSSLHTAHSISGDDAFGPAVLRSSTIGLVTLPDALSVLFSEG